MDQIIIKQQYFDNIKTAVDAINQFFDSGFETKNFPADKTTTDWAIANIIDMIEDLDPVYVSDADKMNLVIEDIQTKMQEGNMSNDQVIADRQIRNAIESITAFKSLEEIADNFDAFSKFVNGIYTFELFMKPSMYRKEIDLFSEDIQLPYELEDLDIHADLFSVETYVTNLFNNPDITFPTEMNIDSEIKRILEYRDIQNAEVVVDNTGSNAEAPTQEYAMESDTVRVKTIKHEDFTISSRHIRFTSNKFQISKQYEACIDNFISNLRKCDSVSDLRIFLEKDNLPTKSYDFCIPYILAKALKDINSSSIVEAEFKHVFDHITGNSRYKNYSIYDTFKTDKDGTIKFLEDYMKLNLYNSRKCNIANNVLLSLFNTFDSTLYFTSLYKMMGNKTSTHSFNNHFTKNEDMKGFATEERARINKNSKETNKFQPESKKLTGNDTDTSAEVQESTFYRLKAFGDMSVEDMMLCESYKQILRDEISIVGDAIYNNRMSPSKVDNYVTEASRNYRIRPVARGEVPDYMKSRMALSDGEESNSSGPKTTDVPDPLTDPQNSINDLADSVNNKMDMPGNVDDILGQGFEDNPNKSRSGNVYNITYNNSFNKNDLSSHSDSSINNTTNDLSTGKSVNKTTHTNSHNSDSHNSQVDSHNTTNDQKKVVNARDINYTAEKSSKNNNDNSDESLDTKDSKVRHSSEYRRLSNGKTVQEMFAFLESEEPLSDDTATTTSTEKKPPKEDSLTRAMDRDRKSRAKLQEAKKGVQKTQNTVRAAFRPIERTKQWLANMVNSLVERDENKVKEEIIENPSYRTSLYKALRLAVKLGLTGIAFTISGYLGAAVSVWQVGRMADKQRLRREVQDEMVTELRIMDEKITKARADGNQQELYKLMRIRSKMESIAADASRGRWKSMRQELEGSRR